MIYKINCKFSITGEIDDVTYYAASFKDGYEMFKKLGAKLRRTGFLIRGKMYERREGRIRRGVYYIGINIETELPAITMSPATEADVKIWTVKEAFGDLHWKIFNKEMSLCVPGLNDLKFHYKR